MSAKMATASDDYDRGAASASSSTSPSFRPYRRNSFVSSGSFARLGRNRHRRRLIINDLVFVPAVLAVALLASNCLRPVAGHGQMTSPRSRNWVAWQDGVDMVVPGARKKEYCVHCLNVNDGVCGKSPYNNYDVNVDSANNPMPWISQATFVEGDVITVKSYLDTHHNGHMELRACAMGPSSTQACFDTPGNELHFVEDITPGATYLMPKDDNYPERGMYAGGQGGSLDTFEMKFQLPMGVYGDNVMLQWKYITANSCSPPGYAEYFGLNNHLPSSYWTPGLALCTPPYPNDGTRGTTWPEQFFNCAEVTIEPAAPTPPTTPSPTVAAPVPSPSVAAPSPSPVGGGTPTVVASGPTPEAGGGGSFYSTSPDCKSSYDALLDMGAITATLATDPPMLSVVASGGAAGSGGDTVSESQAYGLLTSAIAVASLDKSDPRRDEAMETFHGYFNGWKKMCENSAPPPCQSPVYCDGGTVPCLPGWKHTSDLNSIVGTGSAPDGDEDAIAGMIIAVKAVESDTVSPSWYDEVRDWADRSCTQFIKDNTVISASGAHRLLKLGSCWGGWQSAGNNPSYHSPGQYRLMRDFQDEVGATTGRTYVLPSLNGQSLAQAWDMLIDTSYKALETAQCADNGLVPNWALVQEIDSQTLDQYPGSFSGSGTPQYEFGSEASRTLWRIAFDAAVYPVESASQSGSFLAPLLQRMVDRFDPTPINTWEHFAQDVLQVCGGVNSIHGSWQFNGFMFGPVYSSLVSPIPDSFFVGKSFTQQDMVDEACAITSNIGSESYYPRSWMVLATMMLNGGLARVGDLLHGSVTQAPTVSTKPTSEPAVSPTSGGACCTIDFKNCSPTVAGYCSESEAKCTGECDKFWLPNGPLTGCNARWEACNTDADCCSPGACINGQCELSPASAPTPSLVNPPVNSPTNSPISSPVASPIGSPVSIPTNAPVHTPTNAPVSATSGCCSQNFKDCVTWCGTTQESCLTCSNTDVYWIGGAQSGCLERYRDCTNDQTGCCIGLSCVQMNPGYFQCVISSGGPSPTAVAPTAVAPTASPPSPVPASPTNSQPTGSSGGLYCCEVDTILGTCPNAQCNLGQANCLSSSCNGNWISYTPPSSGCCSWGGSDCQYADPASNPCHLFEANCGRCGGSWRTEA